MTRQIVCGLAAAVAIAAIAGCGDNARTCGTGTMELEGVCVPAGTTACGDGTKLDNGQCVVDPATCQAGTVLIADHCVDPARGLTIDLEESAEPNALGIATGVEASATPAGTIALAPVGQTFVVHGHLDPFRDANDDGQLDPDVDTYAIDVATPTLLAISVDGVGGAQGAFYLTATLPGPPMVRYERYGLNLTGDTAKRRVFLPRAGEYLLGITDTRSLAIGKNPPPAAGSGGAAGGLAAEYYASLTVEAIPTPSAIPLTAAAGGGSAGTQAGTLATDEVKFFTVAPGVQTVHVSAVMAGAATASIAVNNADSLDGYAEENPVSLPPTQASVAVNFLAGTVTPLIAVDAVYNYGPSPEPFVLTIATP
jgi:hypothetical protein